MSNSGLIDIHVLEETTSRVSNLTNSITKQVSLIEELSLNARKALGPSPRHNHQLDQFRENASSVLSEFDKIEKATKLVLSVKEPIGRGPVKMGWQEYAKVVSRACELSSELSMDPELRKFPQLPNAAKQQFLIGIGKLHKYVKRYAKLVFVPVDGERYLGSSEPIPQLISEDVVALSKLVHSVESIPEVSPDSADEALMGAIDEYMEKSLSPTLPKISQVPGNSGVLAHGVLCEDVKAILLNGLNLLFDSNHQRLQRYQSVVDQLTEREVEKAASLTSHPEKQPSAGPTNRGVPSGSPTSANNAAGAPGRMASEEATAQAPASGKRTSTQPSIEALQGPRTPRDSQGTPPVRSSQSPGAVLHPLNTASAVASGPGGGPASGSVKSPATPQSAGPQSVGTPSSNGPSWTAFEQIENSRYDPDSADELAKHKREGLAMLCQVFVDIEAQCRKSPITSEFGVSGASLQFMKTLQNISSAGHGVEVVLSELSTRAYLGKPLAPWAAKSEPGPAARANPVSLYYSDAVLCLYSSLHQIASEQLKDTTKTGIFMLSNLSAIEHYITNSNTETLATVKTKTEIMDHMGDVALQKLQQLIEQSFKEYLTDWSKLAPHLMESTITGAASAKLSNKDRDTVKEKFRLFNSEFESLVERQKKYQVSDPVLRSRMSQEVKKLIGPLYMRFYQKHKDGDFTKNISKYVKYTPAQFDEAIKF